MTDDDKKEEANPETPEQSERTEQSKQAQPENLAAEIALLIRESGKHITAARYDEALRCLVKAKELSLTVPAAQVEVEIFTAGIYELKGDYNRAIEHCNEAIHLAKNDSSSYAIRGRCYAALRDFDRAIADHNKAVELSPGDAKSYANRGATYMEMGNYRLAIANFNKGIEIDPNLNLLYHNRALAVGRHEAAETAKKLEAEYKKSLAAYADPVKIRERFDAREKEYRERLVEIEKQITTQNYLLRLVMAAPFLFILLSILPLFGLGSDGSEFNPWISLPILSAGFALAFPIIWRLRDLYRQRQILQMCIEDYFRKGILLEHILVSGDDKEMRQALLRESHRHFANRSAAEFMAALAGKGKLDDDTGHPVMDTAKKVLDKVDKNGGK